LCEKFKKIFKKLFQTLFFSCNALSYKGLIALVFLLSGLQSIQFIPLSTCWRYFYRESM